MKATEIALLIVAFLIGVFGLIMILGGIMNLSDGTDQVADLWLVLGLGVLPLAASLGVALRVFKRAGHRRREAVERQILDLARQGDGRLTAPEIAHATDLTLEEAKAMLDHFHLAGHCQTDIDPHGNLRYVFPALTPE